LVWSNKRALWLVLALALVAMLAVGRADPASAVTPGEVTSANDLIQSGFASAHQAERSGGNVTALVADLNEAIQLVQEAVVQNATDPAGAAADLGNATHLAQAVAAESPSFGRTGLADRQATEETSIGAAVAVVSAASLVYLFGERVYLVVWLRLYKDYVVRPADG